MEKLTNLIREAEIKLDEHNADYGTKEKYCLCCYSTDYDTIVGILHYPYCIIRRLREELKQLEGQERLEEKQKFK